MYKEFATDDHAEVISAAGGSAFQFFDRSDKITKSASDAISREDIAAHMPPHSHFGVHLITMGAEEDFGPNRNADSASRACLEKYHPTFEKFGCVFREHKNKCATREGVGQVKFARYNPRMSRGELIVWVDKEKAPDMYKSASEGKELSWSMSMRLPYDRCSCCDNKSKRTADYCGHLKSGMLKFLPEFQKFAYARNEDDVKFFDISEVMRRADRIATYLGYSFADGDMAKAASEDAVISGAEWASFHGHPDAPVPFTAWENLTLQKMAAAERFVRHADEDTRRTLAATMPQTLGAAHINTLAEPDFRSVGGELAKRAMILDFPTFASIITGKTVDELRKDACYRDVEGLKLPFLMSDMEDKGGCDCCEEAAEAVSPDEWGCSFSPKKDAIDQLIADVGDNLGMEPKPTVQRALTIVVKQASITSAAIVKSAARLDPFYSSLAEAYGYYLVKAAHIAKDVSGVSENTLMRGLAAMQFFAPQKGCKALIGQS
jgi:hypothetical protein